MNSTEAEADSKQVKELTKVASDQNSTDQIAEAIVGIIEKTSEKEIETKPDAKVDEEDDNQVLLIEKKESEWTKIVNDIREKECVGDEEKAEETIKGN